LVLAKINEIVASKMLQDLPLELQLSVMTYLDPGNVSALSATCKHFCNLSTDESIWIKIIFREFGLKVKSRHDFSPRHFYKSVLHPHKHILGVWNRTNLKFYGGILKVTALSDSIRFQELIPPHKIEEDFKICDFMKICYSHDTEKPVTQIQTKILNTKSSEIRCNEESELIFIFPDSEDITENPADWRSVMTDFITTISGEGASMTDLLMFRFIETIHSRSLYRYKKLQHLNNDLKLPIVEGLYVGTYGGHGMEVIQLSKTSSEHLVCGAEGTKITGDPNVAFGKVSFRVTDDRCLDMTKEEQDSMFEVERFSRNPKFIDYRDDLSLVFAAPVDAHERETIPFSKCIGRWNCECQIAQHGGYNATFIPGHFILFSQDYFAVLFIELRSLSLYKRVSKHIFE